MKIKKIAALVLAVVMLLSLSACGMDLKLTTSILKLSKVQSMHMDIDGAMDMSVSSVSEGVNETLFANVTGGIDFIRNPLYVAADLTASAMDTSLHILARLEDKDGLAVLSYSLDEGASWETLDLGEAGEIQEIDPIELLEALGNVEDLAGDFTAAGSEMVLGSEATRYDSTIPGATIAEILQATGAEDTVQDSLGTDLDLDFSSMADVKLSVWVDKASGMPVRGTVDMAEMAQSVLDASMGAILKDAGAEDVSDAVIALRQLYLTATLSNFDREASERVPNFAGLTSSSDKSPLQVGSRWRGTVALSGHSGRGSLEEGLYDIWGVIDTVNDRVFFEIYDYEGEAAMESDNLDAKLSFWAEIEGNRIVPVIGEDDAWLLDIYLTESDTDELTFVYENGALTANYFYYDSNASEACDMAFVLHPMS